MMEADEVNSVVQSNFMRSYKANAKYESDKQMLPNSTKAMIERLADRLSIGGAE